MKGLYSTCGWCLCSQPWIFLSISGSCSTACAAATTHWELLRAACTCHSSFPFHSLHYCHPLWFWWPSHEPPVGFWGPGVADGHTSATPGSTEITQQNFPSLPHPSMISSSEEQLWKRSKNKWEQQGKNSFSDFSYLTIPVWFFPLPDLDFSVFDGHLGNGGKSCATPITAGNVHHNRKKIHILQR